MTAKASPSARTWSVDDNGPADFKSIQEAINNASSGDTIFVHMGTYYEHVFINKTIILIGEDNDFTIIDGNETDNVVYIKANNVNLKNFTIRKSGMYPYCGILTDHSMGNVITENKIMYNQEGISFLYSDNNLICDNIISNNTDGIYAYVSNGNMFSGNIISSNSYDGIYLYSSSNNVVSGNTFLHNDLYGIILSYSTNNTIYHNNFNNVIQAWSESINFWDYDSEGNYWSDYDMQGLNRNGIGDTPYVINTANRDNYPLMGMFSDFNITKGEETYNVTAISNSTISSFGFQIGTETGNKMIYFTSTGKVGMVVFCRVKIPTALMDYPYIMVVGGEEITPTTLNISSEAYAYLYFTYPNRNQTVTITSSKTLQLYLELLDEYLKLQLDLQGLNETYYTLLSNNSILLYNYTQLKSSFDELNNSYQKYLSNYSEQIQNFRNLTYIFVALTAILIVITVYLSKRSHTNMPTKIELVEEK
jgi:parallel beta-helix repeat protein